MRQNRAAGRFAAVFGAVVMLTLAVVGGPTSAGAATYRVRQGDTLIGIAEKHRVPVSALASANGIRDPNHIMVGRVLVVPDGGATSPKPAAPAPAPTPVAAPAPAAAGDAYVVRPGDTLIGIASRNRVSPEDLATANGIKDPNRLQAGQVLVLRKRWHCPVQGRPTFVNDFGYVSPVNGVHEGVDLFAPRDTPVLAPVAGIVTRFPNPKGGFAVHLSADDGSRYYFAHLERYGAGGRVLGGAVIGYLGNSGSARFTAPHLHFEWRRGGGLLQNPYPLLLTACR